MPNQSARRRVAATQRIRLPNSAPRVDQDPGTRRSVRAIVRTLDALVRAGRPETGRSSERFLPRVKTHLDHLVRQLDVHLEEHAFLQLSVGREAILYQGKPVLELRGNRGLLAAILDAGGVAEILFRRGVARAEIERFVQALHRSPRVPDGVHSAAASLWECDLEFIRVRCAEERLPVRPARFEAFDLANRPVERADEVSTDLTLDPAYTAAAEVEDMPSVNVNALPSSVRAALVEPPEPTKRPEHFMPRGEAAVQELERCLVAMQNTERDEGALELGRTLLMRILEMRLRSRQLQAAYDLLANLWAQSRHRAVAITLRRMVTALCQENYVLEFGELLLQSRSGHAGARWVRKILEQLGETAIEPLWLIYQEAGDERQRDAVREVLTVVAWKDPGELVRHVEKRPWNEVRDLIYVLGQIGGSKVVPALRRWIHHEDSRVRIEVLRALNEHDTKAATTVLCDMLADEDYRVRQTAVWSLATRDDAQALPRLAKIIFDDPSFRERSADERDDFFRTCGRLADDKMRERLAQLVQQRQLLSRGWKSELRRGAALALGESGWDEARAILEKASKSRDARLREACRSALAALAPHVHGEVGDTRRPAPRARDASRKEPRRPEIVDAPSLEVEE